MPSEHHDLLEPALSKSDIAFVPLVSLSSSSERIKRISEAAEGFIYAVTVNGTTGERQTFGLGLDAHLKVLKREADIPVLAGFGISNAEQVEAFSQVADGVVIGSKIVTLLHEGRREELARFLNEMASITIKA
ncbi:tryptophan synthase subunit alpha [Listeria floridensis FSL S10-1187]|uniref:tryptophan synthase n=1 Tax=Listeria floridensis FSL S10-1187 TaxID=1265817 RepID=A0ABP3B0X6_9LIST|nr:tryptophan synthase subunit alpha [Listeria floridensis FSL S10-1187]